MPEQNQPNPDAEPVSAEVVSARLAEIASSPVIARQGEGRDGSIIEVTLPYGCIMDGNLEGEADIEADVSWLQVPVELEGNGIGERLVRAFTVACQQRDAKVLHSVIVNPVALRIRARVFGIDKLEFFQGEQPLPITYEQAVASLERAKAIRDQFVTEDDMPEDFDDGIDVDVDLTEVDTTGWEQPVWSDKKEAE